MVLTEVFVLLVMSVAPVVWRWRRAGVKVLTEPLCMMSAAFLLYYVIRSVIFLFRNSFTTWDIALRLNPASNTDEAIALVYVIAGFCFFHAGYRFWKPPDAVGRIWSRWTSRKVSRVAIWGIGLALISTMISIYAVGGIPRAIAQFGQLRETTAGYGYALLGLGYWGIVFAFLLHDRLRRHKNIFAPLAILAIANVCDAFFGNRTGVVVTWTTGLLLYVYASRGQKGVRAAVLLIVVLAAGVGFALPMARMRESPGSFSYAIAIGRKYWTSEGKKNAVVRIMDEFVALDSFAIVIHAGPGTFPFHYGGTYLDSLLFVVPRSIWHNKPQSFSGAIGRYLYKANTDLPPGFIGELYINFHIVGVTGGMYLLGWLLRKAHQSTLSADPVAITVYSVLLPYLIVFMGRSFIGGGTLTLIPFGLMLPIMHYFRRRPGEDPIGPVLVTWSSDFTFPQVRRRSAMYLDRGHPTRFAGWDRNSRFQPKVTITGIPCQYLFRGLGYRSWIAKAALGLWTIRLFFYALTMDADLVHVFDFFSAAPIALACRLRSIPFVYEAVDNYELHYDWPSPVKAFMQRMDGVIARWASAVIVSNERDDTIETTEIR